jgi:hypothetical protein
MVEEPGACRGRPCLRGVQKDPVNTPTGGAPPAMEKRCVARGAAYPLRGKVADFPSEIADEGA